MDPLNTTHQIATLMEIQPETKPSATSAISQEDVKRAASLMLEADYTVEETIQSFVKRGYSEADATMIVAYASQVKQTVQKKNSGSGVTHIVIGSIALLVGIGLTVADIGYIFYGAIVFGIIKIVQGIIALND